MNSETNAVAVNSCRENVSPFIYEKIKGQLGSKLHQLRLLDRDSRQQGGPSRRKQRCSDITGWDLMIFWNNLLINIVASLSLNSLHEDESSSQSQATSRTDISKAEFAVMEMITLDNPFQS